MVLIVAINRLVMMNILLIVIIKNIDVMKMFLKVGIIYILFY